jgi:HSP20 family protein
MANLARQERNWFGNQSRENNGRQLMQNRMPGMLPFGPISSFFLDMDRLFDNTLRNFGVPSLANMNMQMMFNPKVDITSNENEYTITCEVPGLEEKDIKLDVSNNGLLTISGEKRQENSDTRQDVHCTECSYGAFERSLSLPEDVDVENIEANFRNGVLTITCPRNESAKQSRRQIRIESDRGEGRGREEPRGREEGSRGREEGRGKEETRMASNANERMQNQQGQKKAS